MKSIELNNKAAELESRLESKRQELTTALVDGKDPEKLLNEIARLENETRATKAAAGIAAQREAAQAEAERLEQQRKMEQKVDQLHEAGIKQARAVLARVLALADGVGEFRSTAAQEAGIITAYGLGKPRLLDGQCEALAKSIGDALGLLKAALDHEAVFNPGEYNPLHNKTNAEALKDITAACDAITPPRQAVPGGEPNPELARRLLVKPPRVDRSVAPGKKQPA